MKVLVAVLGGALLAWGCGAPQTVPARSSGSIGITQDDALLYVADSDHDQVTVLDARSLDVIAHIPVGDGPERVLVAPDGAVFVSNRGDRTVSRIAKSAHAVEATAPVGAEPVGMALSPDGQRLYVANSMAGTVSLLDAKTLASQRVYAVGGQPWAVAVAADERRAYVTDFLTAQVLVLELASGQPSAKVELTQAPGSECLNGTAPPRTPAQAADVVLSPDGYRAYVAHVQSRTGAGERTAPSSLALAVAPALSTVDTRRNRAEAETHRDADFPSTVLATNLDQACRPVSRGPGMDAPSSLVVDGSGEWIFVADHNSNAVAVVSATRREEEGFLSPERGIHSVVRVGARPTGIAVSADLRRAYVHNALDYSVSVLEQKQGRLEVVAEAAFARSPLPPEVERGKKLFYSAVDPRMTAPELGGLSCSSCHPDGRADGLNWVLPPAGTAQPSPGVRNTPVLWNVAATAPYHWDGMVADLGAFNHEMVGAMGGGGLDARDTSDLSAYLATLKAPVSPHQPAEDLLAVGRALFEQRCASCHRGEALTDNLRHATTTAASVRQLETPSLVGAFASPPYLHDGSAKSLSAVLSGARFTVQAHDLRAQVSAEQLRALEAYLRAR